MSAKLSRIISRLQSISLLNTPFPNSYVKPYLQNCDGTFREVRVVIDNIDLSPHVGKSPPIENAINDKTKEIVLAVGINYGQGCRYCKPSWITPTPLAWMDDTEMRPRIDTLGKIFSSEWKSTKFPKDKDKEYHLVVTNIFPFITKLSWSGQVLNGIEEAKLLQDYWNPAIGLLDQLVTTLSPDYLIFHGANNAVPLFGMSYVSRPTFFRPSGMVIILCDNLAWAPRPIQNCEIL